MDKLFANFQRLAVYILLGGLLWWALRNVPLRDIWNTLLQLKIWQIILLLGINALVIICISMRWWLVARAGNPNLPFLPLIGYRLAVFAMSYFTPGPQVGGEPLQIITLRRYHAVSFAHAASAVIVDKLLEFLGNFLFIGIGLFAVARVGILPETTTNNQFVWAGLAVLTIWPPLHIVLLYLGRKPISAILKMFFSRFNNQKWFRLFVAAEYLASTFIRRHPAALFSALAMSLIAWTGMGFEYLLMLQFLAVRLDLWQGLAALTASLLAFLMPLPGGLGALEASQVLALGAFSYAPATAISLTLLMRARDLINGGMGLLLGAHVLTARRNDKLHT